MDGLGKANEHGNDYDNDYESKTKKSQEDKGKGGEIDFWSTNMTSTSPPWHNKHKSKSNNKLKHKHKRVLFATGGSSKSKPESREDDEGKDEGKEDDEGKEGECQFSFQCKVSTTQ